MSNVWGSPKNVFIGENADGSTFKIIEWDYSTFAAYDIIHKILILAFFALMSSVISPVLLIMSLARFTGKAKLSHILGILISGIFLFDAYKGWLGITTLNLFLSESFINILVSANIIAIIGHLVILFFGGEIYKLIGSFSIYLMLIWITVFGVIVSYGITSTHVGWVEKNIGETSTIEQPVIKSGAQINSDANKRYIQELKAEGQDTSREFENK